MMTLQRIGIGLAGIVATLTIAPAARAQVLYADVGKNIQYEQTAGNTVVPFNGGTNAFFFTRSFFANLGDYNAGTTTFSGVFSPRTFNIFGLLDCCGHPGAGFQSIYLLPSDMDSRFPTGIPYTMNLTGPAGNATATVSYLADIYTNDIPKLSAASFNALQTASPVAPLTINFNAFTPNPGASLGQGFFDIFDLTAGGVPWNAAGFSSSTTSLTIPAGTFTVGHDYVFQLIFDDLARDPNATVANDYRSDVRTVGYFTVSAAVPEPATWAMMIGGMFMAGGALRRRRRLEALRC